MHDLAKLMIEFTFWIADAWKLFGALFLISGSLKLVQMFLNIGPNIFG